MKRRNDIYNVGNDYEQEVSAYFYTDENISAAKTPAGAAVYGKAYSDGLYHYTTKPVYELSGGLSALNKRVFNNLPQSAWSTEIVTQPASAAATLSAVTDASAVFSPDYATVEDADDRVWKKPTP